MAKKPDPAVQVGPPNAQPEPQQAQGQPTQNQEQGMAPVITGGLGGAAGGYLGMAAGEALGGPLGAWVGSAAGSMAGSAVGQFIADAFGGEHAKGAGAVSSLQADAMRQAGAGANIKDQNTQYLKIVADGIGMMLSQGIKSKRQTKPEGGTI